MTRAHAELPVRIAVCLDADDLFGAATGLRECAEMMSRFDFRATLFRLAFVRHANDAEFSGEPLTNREALHKLARILSAIAGPATAALMLRLAEDLIRTGGFHAFSDQALAAAIELAGRCCPRAGGRTFDNPADLDDLARVVFSLQSATFSPRFKRFAASRPAWDAIPEDLLAEVVRNHLAHNELGSPGNGIARLYAILTTPQIGAYFELRTNEPLSAWFQRRLEMTPSDYLRAAFLVGACAARHGLVEDDLGSLGIIERVVLDQIPPGDRGNIQRLFALGKVSADALGRERLIDSNLTDFLYQSTAIRIRPIIDMGDCLLPATMTGLLEKFLIGLPHVLDEAARIANPRVDIGLVRLKFGHLFERYLGLLFETWLAGMADVSVKVGYRETPEGPDWDVLVIRGGTAYYFEAKAKVFVLGMRTRGAFDALDMMMMDAMRETWDGAQRLLALARSANPPEFLRGVSRVAPCLVVFDRVPIRFPYLDRYEQHVEKALGARVFSPPDAAILPLQTFEIEGVESWEEFIEMTPGSNALFDYLGRRAIDPLTRHDRKFPLARPKQWRSPDGPLSRFLRESKTVFETVAAQVQIAENPRDSTPPR